MLDTQRGRLAGVATLLVLAFLLLPLLVVILFSFNSTPSLTYPMDGLSLRWYSEVFSSPQFVDAILYSLQIAVVSALVTAVMGTAAAYALSRTPSRWRGAVALLFFLPLVLPGLFIGIALLIFFVRVDIELSFTSIVIGHVVYVFPYFYFIASAALGRLDPALEEVGADLGASPFTAFRKVTFPQVWPVIAGATALAFALSFDEFVITFFVAGSDATLPLLLWARLRQTVDPTLNAIATLLLLVSVLVALTLFLLLRRSERRTSINLEGV